MFAAVSSRRLDDIGVEQEIISGDLLNSLAGADHHSREPRFSVILLPRQHGAIAWELAHLVEGVTTVGVEKFAEVYLGAGVEQPAL